MERKGRGILAFALYRLKYLLVMASSRGNLQLATDGFSDYSFKTKFQPINKYLIQSPLW